MGETVGESKGSSGAGVWGEACPPHPHRELTARAQPGLLVLGGLHCILGSHLGGTQVPRDLG